MLRRRSGGQPFAEYRDESWQASLFRLALIALMAASLAAGPALLRKVLGWGWPMYLVPAAVIAGTFGVVTTSLLGRPAWRDRRGTAFRLGEVVLLLTLARLLAWIFSEGLPGTDALKAWLLQPASFFTGEFLFAGVALLTVWGFAVGVTADFLDLAIQPDEVAARFSHEWGGSKSEWRAAIPMARTDILQRFALRWIICGALLVVCAALTRIAVSTEQSGVLRVGLRGLGLRPEATASLVCYFLAGLLLLSHGRLAVLRSRWFSQEVQIREPVLSRWHTNSLVFVGLLALLALLAPLGSTGWLARPIEWVIALLIRIVVGIAFVFGMLLALVLQFLRSLFGDTNEGPMHLAFEPSPLGIPTQAEMASRLPPWLGGAVLWFAIVLATGFFLVNFARTTGVLNGPLGVRLHQLRLWWRARQRQFTVTVARRLSKTVHRLRRVRRRIPQTMADVATVRSPTTPRDKVRRYYLDAVQEATEEGVTRPGYKTPLEYAEDLTASWPRSRVDVEDLTSAFVDARYSEHEVDDQRARGAETAWRRLVLGLRQPRDRDNESRR